MTCYNVLYYVPSREARQLRVYSRHRAALQKILCAALGEPDPSRIVTRPQYTTLAHTVPYHTIL